MTCRLAMAGCKFVSVKRALNYRRYYSNKRIGNITGGLATITNVLDEVFADKRCPQSVRTLRNTAFANKYLDWALIAFYQDETNIGQLYLKEAVNLNPKLLDNSSSNLLNFLISRSCSDDNLNHKEILQKIFANFPPELELLTNYYHQAVAQGSLIKGVRAIMWN